MEGILQPGCDKPAVGWYRDLCGGNRLTFQTCFAGFVLNAMDIQVFAIAAPVISKEWSLNPEQVGALAAVGLLFSALGGWVAGYMADRWGRAFTLQLTILWFAGFSLVSGLATDFPQLLCARGLQGFGFGGEWAAGSILVNEIVAAPYRGRAGGTLQSAFAIGWGVAVLFATAMLLFLPPALAWRAIFFLGALPALLVFIVRGQLKESDLFVALQVRQQPFAIFNRSILSATLRGSLLATGLHGGYWVIAIWLPTMLRDGRHLSVLDTGGYLATTIVGSFAGYLTGAHLSDAVGRRPTFMLFALGAATSVMMLTYAATTNLAALWLSFPVGFFATGIYSGIGPILSEIFPTELRGSGQGFCYNIGRGIAGLCPLLAGIGAQRYGLVHSVGLCALLSYGVVVVGALLLPETRGRSLDAIAKGTRS